MNTPLLDVRLLSDAADLRDTVVPGVHPIRTSEPMAKRYQFEEGRVKLGSVLRLARQEDGGDFHHLPAGEHSLMLEDYASFCTLLCAVDEDGAANMLHSVLLAAPQYVASTTSAVVAAFRREADALLRPKRAVVMSGARTDNVGLVADLVRTTFADAEPMVTQLSENRLGDNPLPALETGERYRGMLLVPGALSRTTRSTLFLLTQRCLPHHIKAALS